MNQRLAYNLRAAAEETSVSTKTLLRAIKSGRLRAKRSDVTADGEPAGVYVILAADLRAWLEGLVDA